MRLLLRYSLPWGNFRTKGIDAEPTDLVSDLKEHIERIFGVSKSLQILKLKKSGFTLRLVDNDPLSFYEISNKNQIFIERADSSEVKNVSRVRFLQRLGIGSVIKEEPEGEGDEEEKENKQVNDSPGSSMEADRSSKVIDEGKMHRMEIERHFQTVAEGLCYEIQMSDRFDMLESILNQPPQEIQGDEEMNEMYRKTKYTVWSKKGKMGESPVHKVIMLNRITILQEMLANGLDINAESDDGYTPVQLAILCEKAEIFKIFLSHPTFLLNHVTETRGTPLHTAIQNGKFEFIELLLLHGVDTTVRDKKGFTALEVCDSEDIKRFVEAKIKQKETIFKSMPPKPFLCSGYLYKTGIFFKNLRKRWLVINPDEGSISRFKTKEDAKPL
jgi:Ankyrin repeats (3 copies)